MRWLKTFSGVAVGGAAPGGAVQSGDNCSIGKWGDAGWQIEQKNMP